MTDKAKYRVSIESPHGKRAIESFEHWFQKVADEAQERWGITITMNRVDEQPDDKAQFQTAGED